MYDIPKSISSRCGNDWANHLALAESAFNSSVCASTGFSTFEVVSGRRTPFPGELCGQRSNVPRAEAVATRILAPATACRDHFEESQLNQQERVTRRKGTPLVAGDLVLLSTKNLVTLRKRTACPRLSSRFVGPFRLVDPPAEARPNPGQCSMTRLRRFVERPLRLGPSAPLNNTLLLALLWGQHVGDNIDKTSTFHPAELCVMNWNSASWTGHEQNNRPLADYYPPNCTGLSKHFGALLLLGNVDPLWAPTPQIACAT